MFNFYKSVFGGELNLTRFKDVPEMPGDQKLSEADLGKVMHVSLQIGENTLTLSVHPSSKQEADTMYKALSAGGQAHQPMTEMFWGYWGMLIDQFGIPWMVNVEK